MSDDQLDKDQKEYEVDKVAMDSIIGRIRTAEDEAYKAALAFVTADDVAIAECECRLADAKVVALIREHHELRVRSRQRGRRAWLGIEAGQKAN